MIIKVIRESLSLKWIVFSVLLATIPIAIAGFSIIRAYQENLKRSVIEIEKEKAGMVVERTRTFLRKVTGNLLFLTKDEHCIRGDLSNQKEHLRNFLLHQNDFFVELAMLNDKGEGDRQGFKIQMVVSL